MGDEDEVPQRSLWREILGTLIGSIPLALAVLVWGVSIETRFTRHDVKIEALEHTDEASQKRTETIEQQLSRRFDRIEDKLDRAIARQNAARLGPGITRETGPR